PAGSASGNTLFDDITTKAFRRRSVAITGWSFDDSDTINSLSILGVVKLWRTKHLVPESRRGG
ncbi:hypothetical protein, partial [Mycobacteroides salmoniphilum]|uniref:hypothetical protein n=1 Tax=Mycobacteroides salmoniphilum TaxID=404941 RepID=UPI0019585DF4